MKRAELRHRRSSPSPTRDKEEALPLVRRFYNMGFNIAATERHGRLPQEQRHPHPRASASSARAASEILDLIRSGFVSYVINTRAVSSGTHSQDGASIRRCAIENGVTIFTSLDTARIVTEVLEEMTISVSTINAE